MKSNFWNFWTAVVHGKLHIWHIMMNNDNNECINGDKKELGIFCIASLPFWFVHPFSDYYS